MTRSTVALWQDQFVGSTSLVLKLADFLGRIVELKPPIGFSQRLARGLETMGIPLFAGRDFTLQDRRAPTPTDEAAIGAPPDGVAIVNRRMADRYWPRGEALGARFRVGGEDSSRLRGIGIAGDERQLGLRDEPGPGYFLPYAQNEQNVQAFQLIARTTGPATGIETLLREHIAEHHPYIPIVSVRHLQSVVDTQLARPRFLMTVLSMLAGLALGLAAIGLYGVIAYSVAQRTHEIGVRTALGADSRSLLWLVTRRGPPATPPASTR